MVLPDTARRGEHGFSLVESVIAVAVLGIIVSAMVGGMATSIAMSSLHRQQSSANAVMVSAAEAIKHAPYTPCAQSYLPTPPPGGWPAYLSITTVVQYWNPDSSPPAFDSTCHDSDGASGDGAGGLFPLQLVTILVTQSGSGIRSACPQFPSRQSTTCVSIVKRGSQ
jgi:prepilin-type N-terminal cleavage/methylation domain-containing protein